MPHVELDVETRLPMEKVISMLTDFSDRRPDIWPGLWRDAYDVYSVSEASADVREGNKSPKIWARERYDWSKPGVVRWEVQESNFCTPGSFVEVHIEPKTGGGSRLHVVWDRTPTKLSARLMLRLIALTRGAPVRASSNRAFNMALQAGT
jgi:hypothetical protein